MIGRDRKRERGREKAGEGGIEREEGKEIMGEGELERKREGVSDGEKMGEGGERNEGERERKSERRRVKAKEGQKEGRERFNENSGMRYNSSLPYYTSTVHCDRLCSLTLHRLQNCIKKLQIPSGKMEPWLTLWVCL